MGTEKSKVKCRLSVRDLALCGVLGGMSTILMYIRFPLPFLPPFMSFDMAGVIEIIGGFVMGPLAAFAIIMVKVVLLLITQGSMSAGTGEIQNILLSSAYVIPAVIIYMRHKTKKRAVIGMAVGTVCCAILAVFTNMYLIIPFYVSFFGMTMGDIIKMCQSVNPYIKGPWGLVLMGVIPFNLVKNGILSVITYLTYKKISVHLKHFIRK